jgi:hypothetical protein
MRPARSWSWVEGQTTAGRGTFEPGWRWSQDVKPIAGTDSCQAHHAVHHLGPDAPGPDRRYWDRPRPGDAAIIPPGHDAWTAGDEACVAIDFTGVARYAKKGWLGSKFSAWHGSHTTSQEGEMPVKVGDRITVSAANVNAPERTGTVATVVRQDPLRVEVRWDDGHTTVISPADGAASIVSANTTHNRTKSRPAAKKPTR